MPRNTVPSEGVNLKVNMETQLLKLAEQHAKARDPKGFQRRKYELKTRIRRRTKMAA